MQLVEKNKSKVIKEETSDYSNSSKDKSTQSTVSLPSNIPIDGTTVLINGIPGDWRDNFFVKKKVMNAIKSKFDNISITSLTKDTNSEIWILTLGSNVDVQSMIGQSLHIIEGNTTQHTLTFMASPN